jgi:hypothetical protein
MGSGYFPETLAPNVCVNIAPEVSLIDTASCSYKRDGVGTIARSYFLKRIFERVRKVKFLLVLQEDWLTDDTGHWIAEAFNEFIEMVNFSALKIDARDDIKRTLSVVVNRAKRGYDCYNMLKLAAERFRDCRLAIPNRESIV